MKNIKYLITGILIIISVVSKSQNLQLHFDPRRVIYPEGFEKNHLTMRLAIDKQDKWGNFHIQMDFDMNQNRGNIGLAYMEIARNIKLSDKFPVMAHLEYNGGLGISKDNGYSIPNAYLIGASYMFSYRKLDIETYLAYRYNAFEKVSNDIQWTIRWSSNLCNEKLTVSGFLDIWTENKDHYTKEAKNSKQILLLAEPQFWYNLTPNLSFGTEIEVSYNLYRFLEEKVYIIPTLAIKWNL